MMLSVANVDKRYGTFLANNNVSVNVREGSIFGLLGPNGAGKTTLIRMITNIILPDAGEIRLQGELVGPAQQNLIGYLPEERGLYKKMKVGEQLVYFGQLKGLTAQEALRRGLWWLHRMNADGWEKRKVQELSKGMQQKVQFIATILHEPKLLILDEPFSGLDPVNASLLIDVIHELRSRGTTIILSTHLMDQVERLCDDITLVNKGSIVLEGSVRSVKSRFATNRISLTFEGDGTALTAMDGIVVESSSPGHLQLVVENAEQRTHVLRKALDHVDVRRFEVQEPSLHDIFIRTVTEDVTTT